ncbi:hypothetical protein V5P93_001282 [Actinokineospora auranticolor]|uniref:DUF4267 domain-containing protein n=1 Tax=Actinokineospora auranticolor TaxID=155976 RepID=A0A2S6GUN8_9PSEU|nr:hypothetical protein [Actinokineospora auranticolor]PPK68909.1 hypothetical protein CLV40_104153 [Actinokineospora auranticolor]
MAKLIWIPRALGLATAAYGAAILARPALMARPTGLVTSSGEPARGVAVLTRSIGARDLATGLAMAVAPAGAPLRTAIAVRVVADVVDAVGFGTGLPDASARGKSAAVAGAWAGLCALSALASGR